MARTLADHLIDTLSLAGVQRIFGVVGDSLNPVTDAIRRGGAIQWIDVRHEETGAFAAGAEAQLTGQLAVCAGSCGPGNLHLINGLYDAHRSMAPVVAIAAHIPSSEIGTGYFQETHPTEIFRECSHYCELVSNPHQGPRVFHSAVQHAVGRRGVSLIVLPGDVAAMDEPPHAPTLGNASAECLVRPTDHDLGRLADLINGGKRVALFCGIGCAGAHDEVVALAKKLSAPVGYSFRGKEWVEYDNPNAVGMSGLLGWGAAYKAMHECDVLLLLGTDFPYESFMPQNPKIVQIDIRPERLGRRSKLDLGLCGDVGDTLRALLPLVEAHSDRTFLDSMLEHHRRAEQKLRAYVDHVSARRPIHPEYVAATINEIASDDAIFTIDTGMCAVWGARYLHAAKRRRLLGSFNHGSMANALPQAIGAQSAYAGRQVISFSGDGGLSMLMGELLTVAQYKLPLKIIVFNNHRLGMVQLEQEAAGLPHYGVDLTNPNFAAMAEAIGIRGLRVEDPAKVRPALEQALESSGPVLVDAVTDPNVLSMPPKATIEQAKGFALAMTKMAFTGELDDVTDTVMANWRSFLPEAAGKPNTGAGR
jgi:pyruvate dehydrogenase (quinone)